MLRHRVRNSTFFLGGWDQWPESFYFPVIKPATDDPQFNILLQKLSESVLLGGEGEKRHSSQRDTHLCRPLCHDGLGQEQRQHSPSQQTACLPTRASPSWTRATVDNLLTRAQLTTHNEPFYSMPSISVHLCCYQYWDDCTKAIPVLISLSKSDQMTPLTILK